MVSGDTTILEFQVLDYLGSPVNITNSTVKWVLTASSTTITPLVTKTIANGGISLTTPANGIFQVYLYPSDTAGLNGIYYHEAELTTQSNNVYTVTNGKATIEGDVIV
jgi:hypothetical protein